MALGLFDVVGPIMHGPSSNHTGGANRIGYCLCKLMGGCPDKIELLFHPAYMKSYRGQASHTAMIAGCLGYREYDEESVRSLQMAAERGIEWEAVPYEPARSRNVMGIHGKVNGEDYRIVADSIGGGSIVIYELNGIAVELTGNEYVKVFYVKNKEVAEAIEKKIAELAEKKAESADICRYTGKGFDGRYVICAASASPICMDVTDAADRICPEIHSTESREIVVTSLDPIYQFSDKGNAPLLTTFAEVMELSESGSDRTPADLSDIAIRYEMARSEVSEQQVLEYAAFMVSVVRDSLEKGAREPMHLLAGLADPGDGKRILAYSQSGKTLLDPMFSLAMARAAILAEMNGSACRIVASPTGGAAGTLPAVILTVGEHLGSSEEELARAFLVAALTGVIMGQKASFSGTVGGCQAEIGIGAAMGAAAVTWLAGGDTVQSIHAAALTIKNLLGLSCDPPAPCTEVPCIKRNAMGVAAVFFGTELALAGVRSAIDPDDVVSALADSQKRLPTEIKFGGTGGLAGTPSGKALRKKWQEKQN